MEPDPVQAVGDSSKQLDVDSTSVAEPKKQKFPGCFKKSLAFIIDQIIIMIAGLILFYPFSDFFNSLYQHGWLPGYLVAAIYFSIFESSVLRNQSIGKMLLSIKLVSIDGKPVSPVTSFIRFIIFTIPFINQLLSTSLATTIGITDTMVGGIIFLVVVGVLLVGNTFFILFHPQKRGLHDLIFGTVVVPVNYKPKDEITNIAIKPMVSSVIGLVLMIAFFGHLFFQVGKNPDFSDISDLSERIRSEASNQNLSASYRTFSMNGELTSFEIVVDVPISWDKFENEQYIESISNELYPLAKRINTNPKVDTISLVFHTQKYFGIVPFSKTNKHSTKLSELN